MVSLAVWERIRRASLGPVVLVVRCQSGLTRFDSHWVTKRSGA